MHNGQPKPNLSYKPNMSHNKLAIDLLKFTVVTSHILKSALSSCDHEVCAEKDGKFLFSVV